MTNQGQNTYESYYRPKVNFSLSLSLSIYIYTHIQRERERIPINSKKKIRNTLRKMGKEYEKFTKMEIQILLFFFFFLIYFLFLAALGLHCCEWDFSSCGEWGLLFIAVLRLLIAVASFIVEHGLKGRGLQQLWHAGSVVVARELQSTGSVVVAHGLCCFAACGIFTGQGSNPCALHWQADS